MAKVSQFTSKTLQVTFCIFLLVLTFGCVSSARILDEVSPVADASSEIDEPVVAPVVAPAATLPSNQLPATVTTPDSDVAPVADPSIPATVTAPDSDVAPVADPSIPAAVTAPDSDMAPVVDPSIPADTVAPPADLPADPEPDSVPVVAPAASSTTPADLPDTGVAPVTDAAPVTTPVTKTPGVTTAAPAGAGAGATVAATSGAKVEAPILEHPTFSFFMHDILGGSRPSGRVVTGIVATTDANNLPFSKLNNQIFPLDGGVSLNNINSIINNNNYPFLAGLDGQQQANTVLTSSSDGTSHTLALTALFHGEHNHEVDDTISFFGIHRTATPISHIAIIGGTGKYENAKGFATIETLPHVDQHTTDGLETITHFTIYITP